MVICFNYQLSQGADQMTNSSSKPKIRTEGSGLTHGHSKMLFCFIIMPQSQKSSLHFLTKTGEVQRQLKPMIVCMYSMSLTVSTPHLLLASSDSVADVACVLLHTALDDEEGESGALRCQSVTCDLLYHRNAHTILLSGFIC